LDRLLLGRCGRYVFVEESIHLEKCRPLKTEKLPAIRRLLICYTDHKCRYPTFAGISMQSDPGEKDVGPGRVLNVIGLVESPTHATKAQLNLLVGPYSVV